MIAPHSPVFADAATIWDGRYATDEYIFGTEPNCWIHQQAAVLPQSGRVLCVADGEGRNSVWLAGHGLEVDAFDVSGTGVAKARRLAADKNVQVNYSVADCDSFYWQAQAYDAVVAIFIQFADPVMRGRLFNNILAYLKPGGVLFLQGYTPKQLEYRNGGPSELSYLYTPELLRTSFASLQIIALNSYDKIMQEGSRHQGMSALISMVARKGHP